MLNNVLKTIRIECDDEGRLRLLTWGHDNTPILKGAGADYILQQIEEYLAGKRKTFDVKLCFDNGTEFQQKVWQALYEIPFSDVVTYKELADKVGTHPRAIGGAVGKNPIPIIVPCHRVVAQQAIGGFSAVGGAEIKKEFLDLEKKEQE